MTKVLAVLEEREGWLTEVAGEVMAVAAGLAEDLGGSADALLPRGEAWRDGGEGVERSGVRRLTVLVHEALASYRPEVFTAVVESAVREGGYGAVLLAATSQGKDLAARLAARLDVPLAQEIVDLAVSGGEIELVRPVYAGKALARIHLDSSPLIATIRPHAFSLEPGKSAPEIEVVEADLDPSGWATEVLAFEASDPEVPDVAEAAVVVSGGRGLKGPENWDLLEGLRAALGGDAGLGASRAVVDAGWRPHAEQVGQTGQTVAPRLYFAIGISGAVQHLAGMRTAGKIVAINRDADAPIFKIADYGIVGDLFEVVPALTREIEALRARG